MRDVPEQEIARDDAYVSQAEWLSPLGRCDLVDLVADEFERPAA